MLMLEWFTQQRRFAVQAALAVGLLIHIQASDAKQTMAILSGGPLMGVDRKVATEALTDQQARLLIRSSGEQRLRVLGQLASQQSAVLNRQAGAPVYTEAAVAEMLRSLLVHAVPQQSLPGMHALQADRFQQLMADGPKLKGVGVDREKLLQRAFVAARAGDFADAEARMKAVSQRLLDMQVTTASQRLRWQQTVAGVTALRAHLAVVRFELGEASLLYEEAAASYADKAAIEPVGWLLVGALVAVSAGDSLRALAMFDQVQAASSAQLDRANPFAEWRLFQWMSEVQAAAVHGALGNWAEALKRFDASLGMEEGMETASVLKPPDLAYARWGVRQNMLEMYLKHGDIGSAKVLLSQMLPMAKAMVKAQGDRPFALEALWASQFTGSDMERLEGNTSSAAIGYAEALVTARRLVGLRRGSRASLMSLHESLKVFSNLPEGTLPATEMLAYARERQRIAAAVEGFDPEDQQAKLSHWGSYKNLVDVQVRMGNPGHALDDAVSMLNIAQDSVDHSPGDTPSLQALMLSHATIARLKMVTGSKVGAIDHYGFAVEAAQKSAAMGPNDDDVLFALWSVLSDLGDAHEEFGNPDEALKSQLSARDVALANIEKPGSQVMWLERSAFSFVRLADIYGRLREPDKALDAYAQGVAYGRRFLNNPSQAGGWSYIQWFALSKLGKALSEVGRVSDALKYQEEALKMAELASESEANREEALSAVWFSLREMPGILIKMGELQNAQAKHRAALQIANRQVLLDPSSVLWRSYVRISTEEIRGLEGSVR